MDTSIFRRKFRSGLKRLTLAGDAIVAGAKTASAGVRASLNVAPANGVPAQSAPMSGSSEASSAFTLALAALQLQPPPQTSLPGAKPKRVVMFVISQLRIDPRVEREARALTARGYEVVVIAPDLSEPPHSAEPLDWGTGVSFDLLPLSTAQFVMGPPWFYSAQMVHAGLAHEAFAYHSHDLWPALVALECAARSGAFAVMDFHEWTSENVSWDARSKTWRPHSRERADTYLKMEMLAMRYAARTITVSQTIARALENVAGLTEDSVAVVRNVPPLDAKPTRSYPPLNTQLNLPDNTVTVLYQGGTGPSRLLEPVIQSLAHLPSQVRLVIRGPSLDQFGDHYRHVAQSAGVAERLVLAPPVPSRDVVAAANGASIGLWTLPDLSLNFRYALPNKIFEYLAAGLPLALANYPEAARIVGTYQCGEIFDPNAPEDIARALSRMLDPAVRAKYGRNAVSALQKLGVHEEWSRFGDLYDGLWARRTS